MTPVTEKSTASVGRAWDFGLQVERRMYLRDTQVTAPSARQPSWMVNTNRTGCYGIDSGASLAVLRGSGGARSAGSLAFGRVPPREP
jgi:hypothetical protein